MTRSPFQPTVDDLNSFAVGTVAIAASFLAVESSLTLDSVLLYTGAAVSAMFFRELGQRTIAQWMQAQVDLEVSMEGLGTTAFGAITSILTGWPVILLFPIFNEYDLESYEHWGKSIDAMWLKRKYWIVSGGVVSMFLGWYVLNWLGFETAAGVISLFMIFQLLPFDYSNIPTGSLDGAIVIRWSGFIWLIFMGSAILSFLLV